MKIGTFGLGTKLQKMVTNVSVFLWVSLFTSEAFSESLGTVASTFRSNLQNVASLIVTLSLVAGVGFFLAAIMKFKAHKDNPQQIPLGTPVAMLFIAGALIFLPTIISVTGSTLFSSGGSAGSFTGGFSVGT